MPDDPIRSIWNRVRALGRNAPAVILSAVAVFAPRRLSRSDLAGRGRDNALVTGDRRMPDDPIRSIWNRVRALGRSAPTVILSAVAVFAPQRLSRRDLAGLGRDDACSPEGGPGA